MKKTLSIAALSLLSLSSLLTAPVQAATTSGAFNVSISLTSACKLSTITALNFTYTALGGVATVAGGDFNLQCTKSLSPTIGLVLGAAAGPGTASVTTTDDAVNLAYTVTAPAVTADGLDNAYKLTGLMAAGQAGTCAGATCTNGTATNKAYTLYVNY